MDEQIFLLVIYTMNTGSWMIYKEYILTDSELQDTKPTLIRKCDEQIKW